MVMLQFNGVRMVVTKETCLMSERWSVLRRENDHVREVLTLMEGEWSCYGSGHFKGGKWSCYGGCHFNGERKVIRGSEVVSLMKGG